jgi:glycosyltransferase involved in cell wall biosynthesis
MRSVFHRARRSFANWARERDISAFLATANMPFSMFRRDPNAQLAAYATYLARNPGSSFARRIAQLAIQSARRIECEKRAEASRLHYSLLLKPWISDKEKGVLLISFETELEKIVDPDALSQIESRYQIVFLPSWSGLYSPALIRLAAHAKSGFFVLPVHASEHSPCRDLSPRCQPLPFNAASWVNEEFYSDTSLKRDIDCLMVANFASFKRHWLLFRALRKLPEVTALCVGNPWEGRTAQSLLDEAADYGVQARVAIVENPPQQELRRYFQRAKVFCALSYREGSFIAAAEALVSGTPVVMFRNCHIGTRALIGDDTGALVDSVDDLAGRVRDFQKCDMHASIRKIGVDRAGAIANCSRLNGLLRTAAKRERADWTTDIEPFYSMRLAFYYRNQEADSRFAEDHMFLRQLGIELVR